jgi:hypothetical protein
MDPVTVGAVLAAVADGAGGALGSQVWAGVSALVRRPFRHESAAGKGVASPSSGEPELAALAQVPADEKRAAALAEVLITRANSDIVFREALEAWWILASQVSVREETANTISGGTFHGPVLQGRDFTNLTFGPPASAPLPRPSKDEG